MIALEQIRSIHNYSVHSKREAMCGPWIIPYAGIKKYLIYVADWYAVYKLQRKYPLSVAALRGGGVGRALPRGDQTVNCRVC